MLTPTDVHLLVGLLTQASSPDNVKVELGSLVCDATAEKGRDVDVTVAQAVGDIKTLKGLEVKKHRGPLDVTHVEQLALKLKDMPALTSRQIVSASGYTSPAIKKAAAHGVELFRLANWEDKYSFEHARFNNMSSFCSRSLEYVVGPHLYITLESHGDDFARVDPSLIEVTDERGERHPWGVTFPEFQKKLLVNTTNQLQSREEVSILADEATKSVDISIELSDDPFVRLGETST